jgi:pimeloyl-ACP methyl ester carboxylesterase
VPRETPAKPIIIVDGRGKATVAESGLVQPLLDAGFAVFSVDLRGQGETLGQFGPSYNTNFRLIANQVLFGQPLAGRRAFDLRRAVDYLSLRKELNSDEVSVVGIGDDALPVLLNAASDDRIRQVVVAQYFHSFVSQMRTRTPPAKERMAESWNDPQLNGRLNVGTYEVDFGGVIPSVLNYVDVPDIVALIRPRKVLFCEAKDNNAPDMDTLATRFQRIAGSSNNTRWLRYAPNQTLRDRLLVEWLTSE